MDFPEVLLIEECTPPRQDEAGVWHAVYKPTGRPISAGSWRDLVTAAAGPRIARSLRQSWGEE